MNKLSSNELLDYIILLNIINNLYDDERLTEKEYSYAKIILKQEFGIYYN